MSVRRTRLAPSPTGALHIGNVSSFLINWAIARQHGWELLLRIEDLDGPRKKKGMTEQTIEVLKWIGFDWDGEPRIQSADITASREMLKRLIAENLAYHCELSRQEIRSSISAPHAENERVRPTYRPDNIEIHNQNVQHERTNWRIVMPDTPCEVHDSVYVERSFSEMNDFVIWTKEDLPSYQLSVVADDHHQGVTDVIRGNDLLQSAGWQQMLYKALGWSPPNWYHLPLVLGEDGKRLAKRHGDSRIVHYMDSGVQVERIIGLISYWLIPGQDRSEMSMSTFKELFQIERMPLDDFVYTKEDEQWLLGS